MLQNIDIQKFQNVDLFFHHLLINGRSNFYQ